jgi:hypothetical protein
VQQFGVAHFYATPTVLIIDPSSGALVDDEDRHIWADAYSIDMASTSIWRQLFDTSKNGRRMTQLQIHSQIPWWTPPSCGNSTRR